MSAKRLRAPKAKEGQLIAKWGSVDGSGPDLCYAYGPGCERADSRLLHNVLTTKRIDLSDLPNLLPSFTEELEARGYDITTLRFSISKKV